MAAEKTNDPRLVELMDFVEDATKDMTKVNLNIAVNYGGRAELCKAVRQLAQRVQNGELRPQDVTEADVAACLYTGGQPDPDLIIRPSGEYRLSNFLTWQSAYAEFWFSDILWPDFTTDDFDRALADYANRSRRFGGI